jgi:SAM-dependent methyltransferase
MTMADENIISSISKYYEEARKRPEDTELEAILYGGEGGSITKDMFQRLMQYLVSTNKSKFKHHDPELHLCIPVAGHKSTYRLQISPANGDAKTRTQRVVHKSILRGHPPIHIDDEARINLKRETEVVGQREEAIQLITNTHHDTLTLRLRQRFSVCTSDGMFRIDMTIVRMKSTSGVFSATSYQDHLKAVATVPPQYEVEIEYDPSSSITTTKDPVRFAHAFSKNIMELSMVLTDTDEDSYVSWQTRESIRRYVRNKMELNNRPSTYPGPMPITLELRHMCPESCPNDTIMLHNRVPYTVTDKADGTRCLLCYHTDRVVYSVSTCDLKIRKTSLRSSHAMIGALLDAEHIVSLSATDRHNLYMVFDAYFTGSGKDVCNLPLLDAAANQDDDKKNRNNRLGQAEHIIRETTTKSPQDRIQLKKFYSGKNILESAALILDMASCRHIPYHIDGLMFTPASLAVGALYEGDLPKRAGTWTKVLKWKPVDQQTIDFLVRFDGPPVLIDKDDDGTRVQKLDLYVGHRQSNTTTSPPGPFDVMLIAQNTSKIRPEYRNTKSTAYVDMKFIVNNDESLSWTTVPLDPNSQLPTCINGDAIQDQCVVEFRRNEAMRTWIPCKVRRDKSRGNSMSAALNVWRSMTISKVDTDVVRGEKSAPNELSLIDEEDIYYTRDFHREHSASRAMLNFHNVYVKRWILDKLLTKRPIKTLFDLACGKGGDLGKFLDIGSRGKLELVVGADKCASNILDTDDGACIRTSDIYTKKRDCHGNRRLPRIAWIPGLDMSIKLDDPDLYNQAPHGKAVMELLCEAIIDKNVEKRYSSSEVAYLTSQFGKTVTAHKFDMVWCSFAIHYFFDSMKTLESLAYNINYLLADGGYFVGTCLDGNLIHRSLGSSDTIQGHKGQRLIWQIKRMYEPNKIPEGAQCGVGKKIRVFMETINQPIDEYLVDLDSLIEALGQYGIVPLTPEECRTIDLPSPSCTFKDVYDTHSSSSNCHKAFDRDVVQDMSEAEKRYSFMNRWFVFIKNPSSNKQRATTIKKTS